MDSILTSIKKMLGISEDCDNFDIDIITHINTEFAILNQLGAGFQKKFFIKDKSAVWNDFIPDEKLNEMIKTYMFLKVKMVFDPPLSSAVIASMTNMIEELEWRIKTEAESTETGGIQNE